MDDNADSSPPLSYISLHFPRKQGRDSDMTEQSNSSPNSFHAGNQDILTHALALPVAFQPSNAEGVHTSIPTAPWTDTYENDHGYYAFLTTAQNDFVFAENASADTTLPSLTVTNIALPPHAPAPTPPSTAPTANPLVQSTCLITSTQVCTLPLERNLQSIRLHLGLHGHRHRESSVVSCPWAGCVRKMRWMNIPRHIRSCHLGVRFQCENCGKRFTREYGLAKHVQANQCLAN